MTPSCEKHERVAYVIPANPFAQACNSPELPMMNGPLPAGSTLRIHLKLLAAARVRPTSVIVVLPRDERGRREVPGYRSIDHAAPGLPLELLEVGNNTLGSYGMYLHAFASTRGRFDFYIMCEDDYFPAHPDFVNELLRFHALSFRDSRPGVLAGILQGKPVEPRSRFQLHLEGAHIMSAATLRHLYHHTFTAVGWRRSMAARMLHRKGSEIPPSSLPPSRFPT